MPNLDFETGFVDQCLKEGYTIKEASCLYDYFLDLDKIAEELSFDSKAHSSKQVKSPVYKPKKISSGAAGAQFDVKGQGAVAPTSSPSYSPPIDRMMING